MSQILHLNYNCSKYFNLTFEYHSFALLKIYSYLLYHHQIIFCEIQM